MLCDCYFLSARVTWVKRKKSGAPCFGHYGQRNTPVPLRHPTYHAISPGVHEAYTIFARVYPCFTHIQRSHRVAQTRTNPPRIGSKNSKTTSETEPYDACSTKTTFSFFPLQFIRAETTRVTLRTTTAARREMRWHYRSVAALLRGATCIRYVVLGMVRVVHIFCMKLLACRIDW